MTTVEEEPSTLELLVQETFKALTAPRRFAASLRDQRHGLSTLVLAAAASVVLGATVDLMAVAAADRPVAPATVIVDAVLFGARVAVTVAVAGAIGAWAARALGAATPVPVTFAAVGLALVPLLLAPLALVLMNIGLWLIGLGALAVLLIWWAVLTVLNLSSAISGRAGLVAAVIAIAAVGYGFGDRVIAAGIFTLTMQPAFVPELPSAPATGADHEIGALRLAVPAEWRRVSTSNDMARFERDLDSLRVLRLRPRELDTILTGADDLLAAETRFVAVRVSERRLWRVGSDLVVEDVRSGTYEGREITHVLYSRRTLDGVVGLLFHYVGETDPAELLEIYRPIAATLSGLDD